MSRPPAPGSHALTVLEVAELPSVITVREAARVSNVTDGTVRKWCERGLFACFRIQGRSSGPWRIVTASYLEHMGLEGFVEAVRAEIGVGPRKCARIPGSLSPLGQALAEQGYTGSRLVELTGLSAKTVWSFTHDPDFRPSSRSAETLALAVGWTRDEVVGYLPATRRGMRAS